MTARRGEGAGGRQKKSTRNPRESTPRDDDGPLADSGPPACHGALETLDRGRTAAARGRKEARRQGLRRDGELMEGCWGNSSFARRPRLSPLLLPHPRSPPPDTQGAGSGIGKATAELFAQHGASVLCVDINRKAVEESAKEINEAIGGAFAGVWG